MGKGVCEELEKWLTSSVMNEQRLQEYSENLEKHKYTQRAHPTTEHLAPVYVAAGAAIGSRGRLSKFSAWDFVDGKLRF